MDTHHGAGLDGIDFFNSIRNGDINIFIASENNLKISAFAQLFVNQKR